jgi:hypothetical protein
MALVAPAKNTAELQAITGDLSQKGLLRLGMGGSGSGSGVISNYGGVASTPSSPPSNPPSGMTGPFGPPGYPMPPSTPSLASGPSAAIYQTGPLPAVNMVPPGMLTPQMPQAQPRSNVLLIIITIGCFVIVALIIVMFGMRRGGGGKDILASNATASATPAGSETPAPPASAEPITIATVTEVATKPPPPSPAPVNRPTFRPQPAPRPAPAPQPAAEPAEPGFVTVNAYPWAKVTEGAKVICPATPCNKVQMSPGAHTLTFENGSDPSQKQTVTVQIKPGETTPKNIGFK